MTEKSDKEIIIVCGSNKAVVHAAPLRIDFYHNNVLTVSVNAKGLMRFEHLRVKPQPWVYQYDLKQELWTKCVFCSPPAEGGDGENNEIENAEEKPKSIEVSLIFL